MTVDFFNLWPFFSWFSRKQEAPRGSRDEKRRAQHNEGQHICAIRGVGAALSSCYEKVIEHFIVPTVERRRRDKINNWIVQLSKTIPDCNIDYTKTGQVSFSKQVYSEVTCRNPSSCSNILLFQSKGGILSKACEYIKELRQSNLKLGEDINALDRVRIDNQLLRQEVAVECRHCPPFLWIVMKLLSSDRRLEVQESDPEEPHATARHRWLIQYWPPVKGARGVLETLTFCLWLRLHEVEDVINIFANIHFQLHLLSRTFDAFYET